MNEEVVILAKTKEKLFLKLTEKVCSAHSYEVPCVLKVPFQVGNQSYRDFIEQNTI